MYGVWCRTHIQHRPTHPSTPIARHRTARSITVRSVQKETEWEGEFSPGHRLAKRTQSEAAQTSSSPSSSLDTTTSTFDSFDEEYDFGQGEPSAGHGLLYKFFGRFWDELPARYKLVFATSMAFVLCNMVSSVGICCMQ